MKEYKKRYRAENLSKVKQYSTEWNKKNVEKHKESNSKFYLKNKRLTAERTFRSNLKKYGLTVKDYDDMCEKQKGLCVICGKPQCMKNTTRLSVDHCHNTNKVRGLLCSKCNSGLGFFMDNKQNLLNAIKYLK